MPSAIIPANLLKMTVHPDTSRKFVLYYLNSPTFSRFLKTIITATAQPAFNVSKFRQLPLPIVPRPAQDTIVAEIEKQFSRLEEGVAALRRVQANLKRYRAAVLKAACEGQLVPTEAELQESGSGVSPLKQSRDGSATFESGEQLLKRILADRRTNWIVAAASRRRSSPNQSRDGSATGAPDTANLPPLSDGWVWATVEQLAAPEPHSITDGPFGSNLKTEHYMDSGPRVIRLQNIGDGDYVDEEAHITQAHFERLQKHCIFAGDVVIAGFGENPPRSCIIPESLGPAIVKADCIRFKPHKSVLPKYMNIALNSDPVRKRTKGMVHGVGRPRLNLGEIKSIVLPLPPLAEQTRIVAEVERRLSVVEELETTVSANLQLATRLRQSILQKAFTGELA
jgi:type I restriction enzyme S subunit